MLVKRKPFPLPAALARSPLVQNPATVLLVSWLFQGVRGMGRKEASFRLAAEVLLGALACALLSPFLPPLPAALAGFALAHTADWVLNGQFLVALRYHPAFRVDPAAREAFARELVARLRARRWLWEAVICGSRGRGSSGGPHSDIDLRLVFPPGAGGWLRTNLLLAELRLRALARGVPLDVYAEDRVEDLARLSSRESWIVVLDRCGRIRARFGRVRELVEP